MADRGYTRPAIRHEVGGPGHFELMDSEELDGVIEANMAALREIASLVRAGEIYLPEDGVIDIPTRPQLEEPKEPRILSFLELEAIEQEEEEHARLERAKKGAPDPFEED